MADNIDLSDAKTQKIIAIILIGIIVVGLIGNFQIRVKHLELKALKTKSAQKTEELNKILVLKPQLEMMRIEVARLQHEMDSLESIFPRNPDVPNLITNITKISRALKISMTSFKPNGTLVKDYYVENYYDMSILGSYHSVGDFFASIANFDLLININKVNVRVSPTLVNELKYFVEKYKGSKGTDEMINSIQVVFRLTTYSSLQEAGK
ncbi:MAG: type 4a pilus biogenesis protein PilO [Chitinispirillales bacterium]|nr:type 4a pilus biogenesis protein PilO [Chitinispirillales bacterium]